MAENQDITLDARDDDSDFEPNTTNRIFGEVLDQNNRSDQSISPIPGSNRNTAQPMNDSPRLQRPRPLIFSSNDGTVSERVVRWTYVPGDPRSNPSSGENTEQLRLPIRLPRIPSIPPMPLLSHPRLYCEEEKPLVFEFGNLAFEPTAKFNDAEKAYPAKPGIEGFSSCHEKAMAAFAVLAQVNHESDEEDLANRPDVISHFWSETDVVQRVQTQTEEDARSIEFGSDDPSVFDPSSNPHQGINQNSGSRNITNQNAQRISRASYDQWDRETSLLNNPLNYDLWNEFPESSSSSSHPRVNANGTISSSIGTGTNDLNSESVGQQTDILDDQSPESNIQSSDSMGSARTFEIHPLIRQRLRMEGYSSEEEFFTQDVYACDEVSRMFSLDFPTPPTMMGRRIPRSFLEQTYSRGENSRSSNIEFLLSSSDSSDSDSALNDNENEFAGGSVFPRVPEADNTPSSLLNDLNRELDNPPGTNFIKEQIENILALLEHDDENDFPRSGPPPSINFSELRHFSSVGNNESSVSTNKTEEETLMAQIQNPGEINNQNNSNDSEGRILGSSAIDSDDTNASNKQEEISEASNVNQNSN